MRVVARDLMGACSATSLHFQPSSRLAFPSLYTMSTSKAEGRREDALTKQRTQMREDFERQKQSLIQETEKARPSSNRFVGQNDSMEDTLKKSTVGLVRLEDFQQRRKELEEAKAREAARTSELKYVAIPFGFLWWSGPVSRSTGTITLCGGCV